jgi:hypothetical protein
MHAKAPPWLELQDCRFSASVFFFEDVDFYLEMLWKIKYAKFKGREKFPIFPREILECHLKMPLFHRCRKNKIIYY